mmetsp:Transcript_11312/g.16618  ORF Transcript_11312/g.16618 Transcript_11312/m.16618 type:complete len:284 (-) Transcript_11312:85-936(-)
MKLFILIFVIISCSLGDARRDNNNMKNDNNKIRKYKLESLPAFLLLRGGGDKSSSHYQKMVEDMCKSKGQYQAAAQQLQILLNRTREMDERTTTARSGLDMDLLRLSIPLTCLPPELVTNQLRELRSELADLKNLTEPMQEKLQHYCSHVEECLELTQGCIDQMKENEKKVAFFLKKKRRLNHGQIKKLEKGLQKDLVALRNAKQSISDELRIRDDVWMEYVHYANMVKAKALRIDEMLQRIRKKREQQKKGSSAALKDFYKVSNDDEVQEVEVEMTTYVFTS